MDGGKGTRLTSMRRRPSQGVFTSDQRLIRLRESKEGRAHNEAGCKVEAEVSNAWSPRLTS
jgi:hypothetical protein